MCNWLHATKLRSTFATYTEKFLISIKIGLSDSTKFTNLEIK